MKSNFVTLLCVFSMTTLSEAWGQSSWASKASLPGAKSLGWTAKKRLTPGPRAGAVGFSVGNFGYVFGGTDLTSNYNDIYKFDPSANTWTKKTSMPEPGVIEPAAFAIDTVAYIGLGCIPGQTSHISLFYKYDPTKDAWTKVSNFVQGRRASHGFSIDTAGYIIGGYEYGSTPDNSLWAYYPKADTWVKKATMPGTARSYPCAGVVKGKSYVMGGLTSGGVYLKDFYCYDPINNSWSTLTSFPGNVRTTAACVVIDSIIYFGCGKTNTTHFQDWWGFNTTTKTWIQGPSFPSNKTYSNAHFSINGKGYLSTGANNSNLMDSTFELSLIAYPNVRSTAAGFVIGSYGYVSGGTDLITNYNDLYRYDPSNNTWDKKADLPATGRREPVAFGIGNYGYVGLGFVQGASSHLSDMYRYNASTNSWSQIASFYQGRRAAEGFSIDSLGYVLGGYEIGSTPDNSLYEYSPSQDKWTKKATMPGSSRSYPTVGVLNGKAYVMGGISSGGSYLKDFYMYDPSTNQWSTLSNFPGNERTTASVIVIDSVILFGNGKTNTTHFQDWWGYNTVYKKWEQVANFPSNKTYGNAFFSINNKGYVVSGAKDNSFSDSTFELSVSTASITKTRTQSNIGIMHASMSNFVRVKSAHTGDLTIRIYDGSGKVVFLKTVLRSNNETVVEIPDFSHGIYIVEAIQGNNRQSKKVVL